MKDKKRIFYEKGYEEGLELARKLGDIEKIKKKLIEIKAEIDRIKSMLGDKYISMEGYWHKVGMKRALEDTIEELEEKN